MSNKNLLLPIVLLALLFSSCATKKQLDLETEKFRYELECAGNGTQGTYLVKVWTYSRNAGRAAAQAKKNAVHGVIFKGIVGYNGCVSQRPLASNPGVELEHKDFFTFFFDDNKGEYMKYVSITSAQQEILKVGKDYKVGVVVSVQKDALRRALENAGVIKGLNYGF
jgi:hypothetical protein